MHCTDLYAIPEMILAITIFRREVLGFVNLCNEQQIETAVLSMWCTSYPQARKDLRTVFVSHFFVIVIVIVTVIVHHAMFIL